MSLFHDYSYQILHHQTERELIEQAELNRLAREAVGSDPLVAWWRRLLHRDQRRSTSRLVGANGARHRYAH